MNIFSYNIIQLLAEFGTAAVFFDSRTDLLLRATDPFVGQTKLLQSEKPVYICIGMHYHFFLKIVLFH